MKKNLTKYILFLFLLVIGYVNVSNSTWNIGKEINVSPSQVNEPVCYNVSTNIYYNTIERALESASSGQTIMVIPGTNPTITRNCTIPENVILRLPYDVSAVDSMKSSSTSGNVVNPTSSGLSLTVTIAPNVTLTNLGTLQISGILSGGSGGQPSSGHTTESWANLELDSSSRYIQNSSTAKTYCYGFITEKNPNNSSLCIFNDGDVYIPFIVRDFRGGTATSAIYGEQSSKRCFPFNQYETKNIEPTSRFYYSCNLYGMANLYAGSTHNAAQMIMVGSTSSSFLQLDNINCYLEAKRDRTTEVTTLDFYGGLTTNSMSLKINNFVEAKSEDYVFGINYRYKISFNKLNSQTSATFTINQEYKFLPGSSLIINEGAVLNSNLIVFYDHFNDVSFAGTVYPSDKSPAYLENNGTINANALAGYVKSNKVDSVLNVTVSSNIVTYEATSASPTFQSVYSFLTFDKFDENTQLFILGDKQSRVPTGNYLSIEDSNNYIGYKYLGDTQYMIYIEVENAEVVLIINGVSTTYTSNQIVNVQKDIEIHYEIKFTEENDQTSTIILPDGTSSANTSGSFIMSNDVTIKASSSGSGCISPDSTILLADNSTKLAKNIKVGDLVKTWNFMTGTMEIQPVIFAGYTNEINAYEITLYFDDGTKTVIINQQSLYNLTINDYSLITKNTIGNLIGNKFYSSDGCTKTLVSYSVEKGNFAAVGILTAYNLNFISDNLLSAEGLIQKHTFFNVDDNMKYDAVSMANDISIYGLYEYSEISSILTKEQFELLSGKYFKVYVGKGYCTYEYLWNMVEYFVSDPEKI